MERYLSEKKVSLEVHGILEVEGDLIAGDVVALPEEASK
jgi:hypothetical protein